MNIGMPMLKEEGMATTPSLLAWTEEPGRLQAIESQIAGHD